MNKRKHTIMIFKEGDEVRKHKGYEFPGVVVSSFRTTAGEPRYVVEFTGQGGEGMLHIFNAGQLVKRALPNPTATEDFNMRQLELELEPTEREPELIDWRDFSDGGYTGQRPGAEYLARSFEEPKVVYHLRLDMTKLVDVLTNRPINVPTRVDGYFDQWAPVPAPLKECMPYLDDIYGVKRPT